MNRHLHRGSTCIIKIQFFSVPTDKVFMGYRTILLISCFVLTSCQTVTISNKAIKSKNRRQVQVRNAYKRYTGFTRSFASVQTEASPSQKAKPDMKIVSGPYKVITQKFYFFGLFPRVKKVNLLEVCKGRTVSLLQTQTTWKDFLIGVGTLGVISPKTAKIWC